MAYGDYEHADYTKDDHPRSSAFFHGTTHDARPKSLLSPRGKNGAVGADWGGGLNSHSAKGVFSTNTEKNAWEWADTKSAMSHPTERSRVHKVALPKNTVRGEGSRHEWISPSAKVLETMDIKPGQQGTLPINWTQFSPTHGSLNITLNHPSDRQVEDSVNPPPKENVSLETLVDGPLKERHEGQGRLF